MKMENAFMFLTLLFIGLSIYALALWKQNRIATMRRERLARRAKFVVTQNHVMREDAYDLPIPEEVRTAIVLNYLDWVATLPAPDLSFLRSSRKMPVEEEPHFNNDLEFINGILIDKSRNARLNTVGEYLETL